MNRREALNTLASMGIARVWRILFYCALLWTAVPLHAQGPQFTCVVTIASTPTLRMEGLTERTGDVVLQCSGGTPTPSGGLIPLANIALAYNANVTSRITNPANNASEAMLLVDDPPAASQIGCPVSGGCPAVLGTGGLSNPFLAPGAPNVYQGTVSGKQAVEFFGIPMDRGVSQHSYRIVNVRLAAGTAASSPIEVIVSITGPGANIANPVGIVGSRTAGLSASIRDGSNVGSLSSPVQLMQCNPVNAALASSNTVSVAPQGNLVFVRLQEAFAAAFRARSSATWSSADSLPADPTQATPGTIYSGETGFFNPALPATDGMGSAGTVFSGTRLYIRLDNVPAGVQAYTSVYESGKTAANSRVRLVGTSPTTVDANPFSAVTATSPVNGGMAAMAAFTSAAQLIAVYEVTGFASELSTDTNIDIPVLLAYDPSLGLAPLSTISAKVGFAVRSAVDQATSSTAAFGDQWVPRFLDSATDQSIAAIGACPVTLQSIAVTPVNPSIAAGFTQQFTATGTYSDSSTQNLTASVTWASATSAAMIAAGGLATGVTVGTSSISATLGGVSGSTVLTVTAATLQSIVVTPVNPSIAIFQTQQFTATGTYSDSSTQNLTGSVTWMSATPAIGTIVAGGLATGVAVGTSSISATLGVSGSTVLTVTKASQTIAFGGPVSYNTGARAVNVATADLNHDGFLDLVVVNFLDGNVSILLGVGDGTFGAATKFAAGTFPNGIAIGDFNGDGIPDLAVPDASPGANMAILIGFGDGTFGPPTFFPAGNGPNYVVTGDFNGDGKVDLAVTDGFTVLVLPGTGTGSFGPAVRFFVGSNPYGIAVGDFDGDGKLDLAVANQGGAVGTVSILLGTGTGSFGHATNFPVGAFPIEVKTGDFNGDGNLDLVTTNGNDTISVLLGTGTGAFGAATAFNTEPQPVALVVGDFNGDGKLDVVITTNNSADIGIFFGTGTGSFRNDGTFLGTNSVDVAAGDFNGDGKLDIVTADANFNSVSVLLYPFVLDVQFFGTPFPVVASASSGLPVSFNSQTASVCTVSGNTVTLVALGTCTIQALQNGNSIFAAATPVMEHFNVFQGSQTITFGALFGQKFGAAPFAVGATASSGLPVRFNSETTSVCTVSGATVTLVATGACTIQATQAGNTDYAAAAPVNQSFQVTPTFYQLNTAASPTVGGSVTPASGGSYASGTVVNLQATAATGYVFTSWSGPVANAAQASTTITMGSAQTVTANFALSTTLNLLTNPAGLLVSVDGGTAVLAPAVVNLALGAHTIAVVPTQAGLAGTQSVFAGWSDDSTALASRTIVVGSLPATYQATFKTQYQLTMTLFPSNGGKVTPASGSFFDAGQSVPVSATAASGYAFDSWTGPVQHTNLASTLLPMNGPESLFVNFDTVAATLFQTSPNGLLISVDGGTAQIAPFSSQLTPGVHTIAVAATQAGAAGSQYVFTSWSDAGALSHSITVSATPQATYTATFKTQYQLTTVASPATGGAVTPASGFFDSGTVVNLLAKAANGFSFGSWTGTVANTGLAATTVTMGSAQTVTANFPSLTGITLQTVPAGLLVTVDGGAAQPTPFTKTLTQGSHNISVQPVTSAGSGSRYKFVSWSDSGAQGHNITVTASAATYTANFVTQYLLTTSVLPVLPVLGGSISASPLSPGGDGYYNNASQVVLTATPATAFTFSAFGGSLGGALNPQTLTLNGPASVTANFTPPNPAISASLSKLSTYTDSSCIFTCERTDVNVHLANNGLGVGNAVQINSATATILKGTGSVTVSALCGGTACSVGTIAPGSSGNATVTVTITGSVTRFSLYIAGSTQNSLGATLTFSGSGAIVP